MADIRIKDLATTATTTASDDFMAVDGATNGTRKLNAAAPAFLTSVTTPSLTSPAAINLTLGLGTGGTALTLTNSTLAATFAGAVTATGAIKAKDGSGDPYALLQADASAVGGGKTWTIASNANGSAIGTAGGLSIRDSSTGATVANFINTGLAITGDMTISSSTAASANTGALVIAGGLATGAASYFGGAVTVAGSALVQSGTADPFINIKATADTYNPYLQFEGWNRSFFVGVRDTGTEGLFSIAATSALTSPLFSLAVVGGAATFSGAVSITGNVGFYGQAATAKPTGVAVTAAAIHAALVTLNLIAA